MPEPDTSGGRDRAEMLEQFSSARKGKGGVYQFSNYDKNKFTVHIRPPKWSKGESSRFWIGKLESLEVAQRIADGVFYYVGKPAFHFKNAAVTYPPLTCIGTVIGGIPEVLSSQEMCSRYAVSIAKGVEYAPQRKDFIKQVVENVRRRFGLAPPEEEIVAVHGDDGDPEETRRFGLAPPEEEVVVIHGDDGDPEETRRFGLAPPEEEVVVIHGDDGDPEETRRFGLAPPEEEVVVIHGDDGDPEETRRFGLAPPEEEVVVIHGDDGDPEEDAPPLEYDEYAEMALEMSSAAALPTRVSHVAGSDSLRGSDSLHPFVPSFEVLHLNDSGNILRSAGQSLSNTLSEDEKKFQSENEMIEDLSKSSAAQTCTVVPDADEIYFSQRLDDCPNFSDDEFLIWIESFKDLDEFSVTSNAGRESCEISSPILNIPPTVCLPLSKTILVSDASVESFVSLGTARGNSELAMNAKRQKIGG